MKNPILIYDIETDSVKPEKANLKWFGCYSYLDEQYYLLSYSEKEDIKNLIERHKYIIGFNNNNFDNPIVEDFFNEEVFQYKIILDLYQVLAPKGTGNFGKYNKNRLPQMNYKLDSYSLNNITKNIGLDDEGEKGDIDYSIFKKDKWTNEEIKEIKKYLKQDVVLTKKLFEWYEKQFKPLTRLMDKEDVRKLKHLKSGIPSLAYHIICNRAKIKPEFEEQKPKQLKSYSGGHHVEARWNLVTGNIIELDYSSAYPHSMMMCNLHSPAKEGWKGNGYYDIEGIYKNNEMGLIEKSINEIFQERLKAKKNGDKSKNKSYKLIINSIYGLLGNWKFKKLYNPIAAADCTHIVRTWLKKLAKYLEENGFVVLYGFTDSVFVKIPEESNKEELMFVVDKVVKEFKENVPFPLETFKLDIEEEIKLFWIVAKNCYLYVTKDNRLEYKSTLLNKNTPKAVMNVFENYMKPKIIKNLDVNFTEPELRKQLMEVLKQNPEFAAEEYKVANIKSYNVTTSLYYQISKRYGSGKHLLIPNKKQIGVGKSTTYCSYKEFQDNKLDIQDIDLKNLMKWLKPFTRTKQNQTKLK